MGARGGERMREMGRERRETGGEEKDGETVREERTRTKQELLNFSDKTPITLKYLGDK